MREFIVFCSICTISSLKKFTFAISSDDELLGLIPCIVSIQCELNNFVNEL